MIGRIILTCLEIICLVLGIMFICGTWKITGFAVFDSPMNDDGAGWNVALGGFFLLLGILFFVFSLGGKRGKEGWEENSNYGDLEEGKSEKKDKKRKNKSYDEEGEWGEE